MMYAVKEDRYKELIQKESILNALIVAGIDEWPKYKEVIESFPPITEGEKK